VWWDLKQLITQVKHTITIFDYTHPNCIGVFVFDWSSVHEGFAENVLNANAMNVNLGGKQEKMQDIIILLNNPDLVPGKEDTHEQIQHMCFPDDHEDPKLRGQQKGFRVVLME
jgi:hypothetical protein